MATLPAGPVFTAKYTAPTDGSTPEIADISSNSASTDAGVTVVDAKTESESSHKGKIAAAVLLPLLAIIALGVFAYLKLARAKGKEKRRAWAEGVDKRMSTISTGWQSMSAAGAQAAIRNSMAVGDPRASSFSFGAIRPPSPVYPAEGGQAGVGVYASPEMVQHSPGVGLRSSAHSKALAATRVSRVSFAESVNSRPHGRPSGESRRSAYERRSQAGTSRAFHYDADEMPPMPDGAAERASMFVGGFVNPSLGRLHVNTSSTTVNTTGHASRLSRFDEVYADNSYDSYLSSVNGTTQEPVRASARVDSMYAAYGAYAYGGEDIGVVSPKQTSGPMALKEEDVGPALSMMRVQEQEDLALAHSNAQAYSAALGQTGLAPERLPSFPTPVHYDYSTSAPGQFTDRNETLFTTSPVNDAFPAGTSFGQAMAITESPISTTYTSNYFPPTPAAGTSSFSESRSGSLDETPKSPMTGMAPPVVGMSPDDMLRMYAERNKDRASIRVKSPLSRSGTPAQRSGSVDNAPTPAPATPGAYSATRGAYGVVGFDD
ncbi:hypothetical protein VKT23_007725 [Stygiomarasmius scandens]|uniref:Uncharacterized protein n=1 Tax=Marasmiellus scandens TaxID=2682957 RepID=A0ABR1JJ27_9AGAR